MAIFPEIAPDYGYLIAPQFRTDRLPSTDGDYVQRRRRRSAALALISLEYSALTATNERTLFEFFEEHSGGFTSFTFYDFISRVYAGVAIGTGDAVQKIWTLNHRDITAETIYFDGVDSSLFAYSISNRTGTDGQDQIVFNTAPTSTLVLTAAYSGKRRIPDCLFNDDQLDSALWTWSRHAINTINISQTSA